jgi:hypothetical protein
MVVIPSAAFRRFMDELNARRSSLNPGFSRLLIVDPSMVAKEWNVQGQIVKNECNVTVNISFDEQGGEQFPLGPRRRIRRSFSRLYVTYARNVDTEPAVDGKLRTFSDVDIDDEQSPNDKAPVIDPIVADDPEQVTVGVASGLVMAIDTGRRLGYLQNVSTAGQRISLAFNGKTAVIESGMTLPVDDWRQFGAPEPNMQGSVQAVASAAGAKLAMQKGS